MSNVDKIQIETPYEKECLDRIPSVSDMGDSKVVVVDKDKRISELEAMLKRVRSALLNQVDLRFIHASQRKDVIDLAECIDRLLDQSK